MRAKQPEETSLVAAAIRLDEASEKGPIAKARQLIAERVVISLSALILLQDRRVQWRVRMDPNGQELEVVELDLHAPGLEEVDSGERRLEEGSKKRKIINKAININIRYPRQGVRSGVTTAQTEQ